MGRKTRHAGAGIWKDMVAMIGAAVRETLKAASETSKDTTAKDSKLATIVATTNPETNLEM